MAIKIQGIEGKSIAEIEYEVNTGGRFVCFPFCVSIVVLTFRRNSDIFFISHDESAFSRGVPFWLISLVLGWWGIPWGPVFTIQALYHASRGGKDVTAATIAYLRNPPRPFYDFCPGCSYFAFGRGVCIKFAAPVEKFPDRFHECCGGRGFQAIPVLLPKVKCYKCGTEFTITVAERQSLAYACPVCKYKYYFTGAKGVS